MKDQLGEFACRYSYLDTCSYSRHIQYTAIVEFDAAVGVLDIDNAGVEAVEPTAKNKVATWKTFSHLNKMAPRINFQLKPDT